MTAFETTPPGVTVASPICACCVLTRPEVVTVKTFEFHIDETLSDAELAALRWDLFVFHEIVDVGRGTGRDVLAILYDGDGSNRDAWLDAIAAFGYRVAPAEAPEQPQAA